MQIQIDSREKARAIKKIVDEFDKQGIQHFISKLYVGDYMSYDNPRLVVDRKQGLSEVCSNLCQQHERLRNEALRASEAGIKIIFLVEHGGGIASLEDVARWKNPRGVKRVRTDTGTWHTIKTKAITGEILAKAMKTFASRYGVEWQFCTKAQTGKCIIEILSNSPD